MRVPKSLLKCGIDKCCDTAASQYVLGAVRLERAADGDPVAVATDGRIMLSATWQDAQGPEWHAHVQKADWAAAAKLNGRQKCVDITEAQVAPGTPPPVLSATTDGGSVVLNQLDGRFPRWRECAPNLADHEVAQIVLSPKLARKLFDALARAGCDTVTMHVPIQSPGAWNKSAVQISGHADGISYNGMIMPMSDAKAATKLLQERQRLADEVAASPEASARLAQLATVHQLRAVAPQAAEV